MISLHQFKKSLGYALRGLWIVFRTEQSFRIQVFFGLCVSALAIGLPLSRTDRIILFLLIASVLVLELVNSVVERILDAFKPRLHPIVKEAKDVMAAAVFIISLFSAMIGILIFYPFLKLLVF